MAKDDTTITELYSKLSQLNNDNFEIALLFKSYFTTERKLLVDNLMLSKVRDEDIGTINFLGFHIRKLNQIQEERDGRTKQHKQTK